MSKNHPSLAKRAKQAVSLGLTLMLTACGQVEPVTGETDRIDPELGIDPSALTPIGGTVDYVIAAGSTQGQMTISLAADDVALITRRSDGVVIINDVPVTGPGGVGYAYVTSLPSGGVGAVVKKIIINSPAMDGSEHVIIDFINGGFALGNGTASTGWVIDLGATGTDKLSFRGRSAPTVSDNIKMGDVAINYSATSTVDTTKDIDYTGVETLRFALLDGPDIFSGEGQASSPALGNAVTSNLIVFGGDGNDTLRGGDGDDTLYGNAGNDIFWTGVTDDGSDLYIGGADADAMSYGGKPTVNASNIFSAQASSGMRTSAVTVDLEAASGSSNDDGLPGENDDVRNDIETLLGGSGDDTLSGGLGSETIYGGAGADRLAGGLGSDFLYGEDGGDTFAEGSSSTDSDVFYCGLGSDVIDYSSRNAAVTVTGDGASANDGASGEGDNVRNDCEIIRGSTVADDITGGTGNNTLYGNGGNDTLHGDDGHDVLYGGANDDTLYGDDGDDTFAEEAASNGSDTFHGGGDKDTVDYSLRTASLTVDADGMADDGLSMEADNMLTDCEGFIGGSDDDTFTGSSSNEDIDGRDGEDTLNGGDGDDRIDGADGTDAIDCGLGDDICLDSADCGTAQGCEF